MWDCHSTESRERGLLGRGGAVEGTGQRQLDSSTARIGEARWTWEMGDGRKGRRWSRSRGALVSTLTQTGLFPGGGGGGAGQTLVLERRMCGFWLSFTTCNLTCSLDDLLTALFKLVILIVPTLTLTHPLLHLADPNNVQPTRI